MTVAQRTWTTRAAMTAVFVACFGIFTWLSDRAVAALYSYANTTYVTRQEWQREHSELLMELRLGMQATNMTLVRIDSSLTRLVVKEQLKEQYGKSR